MPFFCEHCAVLSKASAYRVISAEEGVVLLDMIVCDACYLEATNLGLEAKRIDPQAIFRSPRRTH
jgi:hypothetical protein